MSDLEACYVVADRDEIREVVSTARQSLRRQRRIAGRPVIARAHSHHPWVQFHPADTEDIHELAESLARDLKRDVVALQLYSVTDTFGYSRWSSGVLRRKLIYGDREEGIWSVVQGEAEAWERPVLFHTNDFEEWSSRLKLDQHTIDSYRDGIVREGDNLPFVNTGSVAPALAEALNLPGFPRAIDLSTRSHQYWTLEKMILWPTVIDLLDTWRVIRQAHGHR